MLVFDACSCKMYVIHFIQEKEKRDGGGWMDGPRMKRNEKMNEGMNRISAP